MALVVLDGGQQPAAGLRHQLTAWVAWSVNAEGGQADNDGPSIHGWKGRAIDDDDVRREGVLGWIGTRFEQPLAVVEDDVDRGHIAAGGG